MDWRRMHRLGLAALTIGLVACGQNGADSAGQAEEPTAARPAEAAPEVQAPEPIEEPERTEPAEPTDPEEPSEPTEVLDGTDLVELTSLGEAAEGSSLAGRYSAEHGGSTARAVIRRRGEQWRLELVDREPGAPPSRRRYDLTAEGEQYAAEGGVYLRQTREGIVVLEPAAEYWVHYVR